MNEDEETAAQLAWEQEMEAAIESRGRTRSRSILAANEDEEDAEQDTSSRSRRRGGVDTAPDDGTGSNGNVATKPRSRSLFGPSDTGDGDGEFDALAASRDFSRRRSSSFAGGRTCNDDDDEDDSSESKEEIIKRATSLSKIYLAGSMPVDVSTLQNSSDTNDQKKKKKVNLPKQTGALSAKALDALSAGLQLTAQRAQHDEEHKPSEEELEEKRMEEEEAKKLNDEKNEKIATAAAAVAAVEAATNSSTPTSVPSPPATEMTPTTTSRASMLTSKASYFKNRMLKASAKLKAAATTTRSSLGGTNSASNSITSGSVIGDKSTDQSEPADAPPPAPAAPKKRHKLKLLLLGDSGVGKTSLMRVFSGDEFSESMLATAGVDFKLRTITVEEDNEVALQIWDTAGQERFHRITAPYYKGANGIVLVYDVSDKRGFDNVGYWMNNIRQYSSPNMPAMLLVGNKIDLPDRAVTSEEGQSTANQYSCRFIETSAKTSENTNGALETIARDAFIMSLHPTMTQKMLLEKEKSLIGKRGGKENCVIS